MPEVPPIRSWPYSGVVEVPTPPLEIGSAVPRATHAKNPLPLTENVSNGDVVPMPTFPFCRMVTVDVAERAPPEDA